MLPVDPVTWVQDSFFRLGAPAGLKYRNNPPPLLRPGAKLAGAFHFPGDVEGVSDHDQGEALLLVEFQ
jgi:hypothetical protein